MKKNPKDGKKKNPKGRVHSINEVSGKHNLPKDKIKESWEKKVPKWFYAVLPLIPVLFIILLELFLRIINYGNDIPQWVDAGSGKYIINPDIGKRYFTSIQFQASTNEDVFDQQKKENSFRVFILGESSAAGYPYMPLGSFSRYIRKRLELVYPNTVIEVINLGMTGVCSYTLLDLTPGILEQKPDLILIYTGHNEYYGALGVGSRESYGASRSLVKLVLYLNKFKVTQLVRNAIPSILSLFNPKQKELTGTLMSKMAKDQYIPLNSEKFNEGVEQFAGNMRDILALVKDKGVPVILGRLVSNLKDQKPFISNNKPGSASANQVYKEAEAELKNHNNLKSDSLFRLAKDLDLLRFRAPEKINNIISMLGKEYGDSTVPIDSMFDSASPNGITGNNLMTDHLHPNLKGYQLIGKAFYEAMTHSGNLPGFEEPKIPFAVQDSITRADFMFTQLDSVIGNDVITLLKSDWPFAEKKINLTAENIFRPKNFIDSIAVEYVEKKISWIDAHLNAAVEYLKRDDIPNHLRQMNVLIYQYPFLKDYNTALRYFYEQNKINPSDFNTKRIGIISLFNKNYDDAVKYLNECYRANSKDAEVLYYLAESYMQKKNFKSSLTFINECLNTGRDFHEARKLKIQIQDSIKSENRRNFSTQ